LPDYESWRRAMTTRRLAHVALALTLAALLGLLVEILKW
jgi:hypothetical protein